MTAQKSPDKPQVFRSPTAVIVWIVWLLFAVGNWIDLAARGRDHASVVAAAILLLATGAAYVAAQRPRIIADSGGLTIRNPLRDHRVGWADVAKVDLADLLRVHCEWGGPADAASGGPAQRKVISAWAVHYSRRRQVAAELKSRRTARSPGLARSTMGRSSLGRSTLGLGSGGRDLTYGATVAAPEPSSPEADAQLVVRVLTARATAAKAEALWAKEAAQAAPGPQPGTAAAPGPQPGTAAVPGPQPGTAAGALDLVAGHRGGEPPSSTWSGRAIAALVIPALILLVVWLV